MLDILEVQNIFTCGIIAKLTLNKEKKVIAVIYRNQINSKLTFEDHVHWGTHLTMCPDKCGEH